MPGEIRNRIYRFVLVQNPGPRGCEHFISSLAPPALTLVNKQTFAEALPIFYAENTFYLLLWARRKGLRDQDPTDFHRFTRMVEYFGRPRTCTKDKNPMRYIKNIIVQIRNSASRECALFHDLTDPPLERRPIYNNLCIRGEQETINYTSLPATGAEVFNPRNYQWNVCNAILNTRNFKVNFVEDAYDLLRLSFTTQVQPISMDVTRLFDELDRIGEEEKYYYTFEDWDDYNHRYDSEGSEDSQS